MTLILDLPVEIQTEIISYLPDKTLKAARLVHRNIEQAALATFGKRFFRKKGFFLTQLSLSRLRHIAEHEGLRKHVQHVWFNPDFYTFNVSPRGPAAIMDQALGDYHRTTRLANLIQELIYILARLPNVQTLGMRRGTDHSPYGWQIYKDRIGRDPRELGEGRPTGRQSALSPQTVLYVALIRAVAASGTGLRRLYTDAIEIDQIYSDCLLQEDLDKACRNLLYLEVNCIRARSSPGVDDHNPLEDHLSRSSDIGLPLDKPENWGTGLVRLLKAAPRLKEIGLQMFPDTRHSHMIPPISQDPNSWRQSYPYISLQSVATHHLPLSNLTRLKLEKVATSASALLSLLHPCGPNLTSLKLREIRLVETAADRPWAKIFVFLRSSCPALAHLFLYNVTYLHGGVSFVERLDQPPGQTVQLQYNPWSFHARATLLAQNAQVTVEATGLELVGRWLDRVAEEHWYQLPIVSMPMDDALWYTDTSDEEW